MLSLRVDQAGKIQTEAARFVTGATKLLNYHHTNLSTKKLVGKVLPLEEK